MILSRPGGRPRRRRDPVRRAGFTLIELLVVVAIISLLMSLLLPSLQRARDQALAAQCNSMLRTHGVQIMVYASDYNDYFPTPEDIDPDGDGIYRAQHSSQYRYYWQVMTPYFSDTGESHGYVDLAYVCPVLRRRWRRGDYEGRLHAGSWNDLAPFYSGYIHSFGNLQASMSYPDNWRFRTLGGMRVSQVGINGGDDPARVGAVPATPPSRYIMLYDVDFCLGANNSPGIPGDVSHRAGWCALFVDGHARLFTEANDWRDWWNTRVLKPELAE